MTYCTLSHLTDRFGLQFLIDLTDRADPLTGAVVSAVVDRAIADTDALIDGYLSGRYELPLNELPALVTDIAQTIVIYKLHAHVAAEKITADYKDALKVLEKIATGTVRLSVAGKEPSGTDANEVQTNNPERPFTNQSMKGFI